MRYDPEMQFGTSRTCPHTAARQWAAYAEISQILPSRLRFDIAVGKLSYMKGPRLLSTDIMYTGGRVGGLDRAPRRRACGGPPAENKIWRLSVASCQVLVASLGAAPYCRLLPFRGGAVCRDSGGRRKQFGHTKLSEFPSA